ncbi:MAG: Spy/CpxP family protein refolding chaperone [Thermodesulfobacteriota bacterium]
MRRMVFLFALMIVMTGFALRPAQAWTRDPQVGQSQALAQVQAALAALDLSADQKEAVAVIMAQYGPQARELGTDLAAAAASLRDTMLTAGDDEAAVRAAHMRLAAVGQELAVIGGQAASAVREVLTPEQEAILAERLAHRQERRQALLGRLGMEGGRQTARAGR